MIINNYKSGKRKDRVQAVKNILGFVASYSLLVMGIACIVLVGWVMGALLVLSF